MSMSSAAPLLFWLVVAVFLAGVTVKSLLSGAMILMERATRSLFLQGQNGYTFLLKLKFEKFKPFCIGPLNQIKNRSYNIKEIQI